MGGCRCSYKNCIRATKNSEKDFHFFHYPVRDAKRCDQWIANAKKPHFHNLPEDQLRNKVVCELHFEPQYFTNSSRKRLVHNAVPTKDAGSDKPLPEEINLQVLQSDSCGSVFMLDTEPSMHPEVRDVQSYLLQNGDIVPANPADLNNVVPDVRKPKIGVRDIQQFIDMSPSLIESPSKKQKTSSDIKSEESAFSKSPSKNAVDPVILSIVPANVLTATPALPVLQAKPAWLDTQRTGSITDTESSSTLQKKSPEKKPEVMQMTEQVLECPEPEQLPKSEHSDSSSNVPNLRAMAVKIEQHSEQIARLKKLLRRRLNKSEPKQKLSKRQIVSNLRGLIPSTLCGAVSLHLLKKNNNFTKDEETFLLTLYNASPAAYEVLLKDCKWKLPCLDTVKKLCLKKRTT